MTINPTSNTHRYQRWDGELNKGRWTWVAIVVNGIRLALKGGRTRTMLMTISLVVLGGCVNLYVLSLMELVAGTEGGKSIVEFVRVFLRVDVSGVSQIEEFREILWRTLFLVIVRVEMFWVLIVVARIGPGLIANDLKHRALPIYFAKPITPLTYITGKWIVIAVFIAMVTLIPNIVTLTIGALITGGLQTWGQMLNLGWDLVLSGAVVCVAAGAIVLALSSLSSDYRFVTVAWMAVCLLPVIGQAILEKSLPAESTTGWLGCISLRDNVMTVTDWLFGLRQALEASGLPTGAFADALVRPVEPMYAAIVLAAWTVGAILLSYRRVVVFCRSAANV